MPNYNRDSRYMHPLLRDNLDAMLKTIQDKLPADIKAKVISIHRTPAEQFEIFKKGRTFNGTKWEVTGTVFTSKDGYINKSRHNYLPATAFDIGLFKGTAYLPSNAGYKKVELGAKLMDFTWGGTWVSPHDEPHIEIPLPKFELQSIEKDNGLIWQRYLKKDGTYNGALDGIFGPRSIDALKASTNETERNVAAWDILFDKHGPNP
jgi:hypothetical protein